MHNLAPSGVSASQIGQRMSAPSGTAVQAAEERATGARRAPVKCGCWIMGHSRVRPVSSEKQVGAAGGEAMEGGNPPCVRACGEMASRDRSTGARSHACPLVGGIVLMYNGLQSGGQSRRLRHNDRSGALRWPTGIPRGHHFCGEDDKVIHIYDARDNDIPVTPSSSGWRKTSRT